MELLKPPKLQYGDTIGIVAPSLPVLPSYREKYELGKQVLQEMGFNLKEGKTIELRRWWSAGSYQEQADDINQMFKDPQVKAIIAHTGGFSPLTLLDLIDYQAVRANPKPFIGYSDITTYHLAFLTQVGLPGFHLDLLTHGLGEFFYSLPDTQRSYIKQVFVQSLTSNQPIGKLEPLSKWESWRDGQAKGVLIGGSLFRFCSLIGTAYFPKLEIFNNAILFWEHIGSTLYEISLELHKLKHIGVFNRISGMVIGKVSGVYNYFEEIHHPSLKEAVLDVVGEYTFPILANVDFGHQTINLPMIIGVEAEIDTSSDSVRIIEEAVIG